MLDTTRREINRVRSIEYNSLMSIMKLLADRLPDLMRDYGVDKRLVLDIIPAYPRDLTRLNMPSVIVRRVENVQSKVALDGFIGQLYDSGDNSLNDIKAVKHNLTIQFDVLAATNTQSAGIVGMISEGIFDTIMLWESGYVPFFDFTTDRNNPVECGTLCMIGAPRGVNLSSWRISVQEPTINEHAMLLRQEFSIIQTIVPKTEYVDLSLWLKQHITLNLKEEIRHG